jgi:YegS/Rv2252/BmrU family lipid kinase
MTVSTALWLPHPLPQQREAGPAFISESSPPKAVLLVNKHASRAATERELCSIERRLRSAGFGVSRLLPQGPAEVQPMLRASLRDLSPRKARVLALGGDGTVRAALPLLAYSGIPLALLPAGTLNVLARQLGIPTDLSAALELAIGGQPREIDLGLANGDFFSAMAGIGYDGAVVRSLVPARNKRWPDVLSSALRGLRLLLRFPARRFRVTADAVSFETSAWLAVVANASRYAYHLRMSPRARLDDGWLDLCLFQARSSLHTAGQVLSLLAGMHASHPGVYHLRARRLRIETDPPSFVQLDGDPAPATPLELEVLPRALTVLTPRV